MGFYVFGLIDYSFSKQINFVSNMKVESKTDRLAVWLMKAYMWPKCPDLFIPCATYITQEIKLFAISHIAMSLYSSIYVTIILYNYITKRNSAATTDLILTTASVHGCLSHVIHVNEDTVHLLSHMRVKTLD